MAVPADGQPAARPPDHHWLTLRLEGARPNRFGIGARVAVTAGERTQVAEVHAGHSYASSSDPRPHCGLGGAARADRILVRWPGGGVSTLRDVAVDREVVVKQPRGNVSMPSSSRGANSTSQAAH